MNKPTLQLVALPGNRLHAPTVRILDGPSAGERTQAATWLPKAPRSAVMLSIVKGGAA